MAKPKCPECGNEETFWVICQETVAYRGHTADEDQSDIYLCNPKSDIINSEVIQVDCDDCNFHWLYIDEKCPEAEWE